MGNMCSKLSRIQTRYALFVAGFVTAEGCITISPLLHLVCVSDIWIESRAEDLIYWDCFQISKLGDKKQNNLRTLLMMISLMKYQSFRIWKVKMVIPWRNRKMKTQTKVSSCPQCMIKLLWLMIFRILSRQSRINKIIHVPTLVIYSIPRAQEKIGHQTRLAVDVQVLSPERKTIRNSVNTRETEVRGNRLKNLI